MVAALSASSSYPALNRVEEYTVITEPAYPAGWRMSPHSHHQYEMTMVQAGACYVSLGRDLRRVVTGDVVFLPSRVSHGHEPYMDNSVELIVVQFPQLDSALIDELMNARPIGHYHLGELDRSRFLSLCFQLQREIAGGLPHASTLCRALVEQMAVLLLRSAQSETGDSLTVEQQSAIESSLEWMHANAHRTVSIGEVAERVGFSPAYFRALFRRSVGVSPKQYLTALRLQSSKCLLMHSERTVAEVAELAGFNSPQEFSKVFRRFTGLPPSEWKRSHLYMP
jgi:AraC-like DNA-binding protein/quercetin dioxygenase-like cupin family protein